VRPDWRSPAETSGDRLAGRLSSWGAAQSHRRRAALLLSSRDAHLAAPRSGPPERGKQAATHRFRTRVRAPERRSGARLLRTSSGSTAHDRCSLTKGVVSDSSLDGALTCELDDTRQRRVQRSGVDLPPDWTPDSGSGAGGAVVRCSRGLVTCLGPDPAPSPWGFVSGVGAQTGGEGVVDGGCRGFGCG
jgi:hypothetical protein